MSDKPKSAPAGKKRTSLVLAEFDTTHDVVHAAEKVRDAGYKNWDYATRPSRSTGWTRRWG